MDTPGYGDREEKDFQERKGRKQNEDKDVKREQCLSSLFKILILP